MSDNGHDKGISDITMSVTTDGRKYDLKLGDFSAIDEMAFKEVTQTELMAPFLTGQINSVVIAGLVWRVRVRGGEKKLQFSAVAEKVTWADLDTIEISDGSEDDEPASKVDLSAGVLNPEP